MKQSGGATTTCPQGGRARGRTLRLVEFPVAETDEEDREVVPAVAEPEEEVAATAVNRWEALAREFLVIESQSEIRFSRA